MTLYDVKKKVLQLIEEIDDTQASLTSDPDIEAKMNGVINQVQFELARMKKIPASVTQAVVKDEMLNLETIDNFYQLRLIRAKNDAGEDIDFERIENMVTFNENGTATIVFFRYPTPITDDTEDTYEFELSKDALEILPYGVAGDLLKSDVSTSYGQIYTQRYETMLQRLDSRNAIESIHIDGGINI
jgi:hypothetical protein